MWDPLITLRDDFMSIIRAKVLIQKTFYLGSLYTKKSVVPCKRREREKSILKQQQEGGL
jgi:hypothetical protein